MAYEEDDESRERLDGCGCCLDPYCTAERHCTGQHGCEAEDCQRPEDRGWGLVDVVAADQAERSSFERFGVLAILTVVLAFAVGWWGGVESQRPRLDTLLNTIYEYSDRCGFELPGGSDGR